MPGDWYKMVRLTKIYTKTGDEGTTALADNTRVQKIDAVIEAIGAVDEANSAIGMIQGYDTLLNPIQNDLFDMGADLSGSRVIRISQMQINRLEEHIDELNKDLPILQSFILPKGDIHNARTVVRRAEREVWKLYEQQEINIHCPQYLNRLSDLLFVLARYNLPNDILWHIPHN